MINKKYIITLAVMAMLMTGISIASAESSNRLTQMDVKRSSAVDTVDVTFYTTSEMGNSVVTRKANNRYVVLLPNVAGSSSVTPGFGAVKDLITDIDVKHVNDGIGGYTKVTFGTTKPINIKTHMKKSQPITQAQKDYKAILAQNNTTPKAQTQTTKPAVNTVKKTEAPAKQASPAVKTAQNPTTQKTTPKIALVEPQKTAAKLAPKVVSPKVETKPQQQPVQPKVSQSKSQTQKENVKPAIAAEAAGYVPKMKFDQNGKRVLDLEPRVSHKVVTEQQAAKAPYVDPMFEVQQPLEESLAATQQQVQPTVEETAVETPQAENSSHKFPIGTLVLGGAILGFGLIYLLFDAVKHSSDKDQTRLQSFFKLSSQNLAKRRRKEYYDIVNNEELSWQEKYKLYTEKEEKRKIKKEPMDMSYVTDLSGAKQALVDPVKPQQVKTEPKAQTIQEDFKNKFSEKMQAKISQMEHALSETPSVEEPELKPQGVKSEEDMIMNKISDVKLKTFSKGITLKETHRTLAESDKMVSRNKSYKEGRFVKLKNSPLSVTKRKSASTKFEVTDLIGTGNKYLTNNSNNGEMKMNKENENYLLSSLDEYLSILDEETQKKSSTVGSLSQLRSPSAEAMTRSGMTNPIARASNTKQPSTAVPYMNGLIVKSGYNIDSEKGFYVVNIDGVSALVGRIKDNVFILKKFDHVVDKPIQVRQDDGSVYIVRVGKYKCLVDVSKDKMGTLIEI